jgi:hypothetical protein
MTELLKSLANPIVWVLVFMGVGLILIKQPAKKRRFKPGKCALFLGTSILFLLLPFTGYSGSNEGDG